MQFEAKTGVLQQGIEKEMAVAPFPPSTGEISAEASGRAVFKTSGFPFFFGRCDAFRDSREWHLDPPVPVRVKLPMPSIYTVG